MNKAKALCFDVEAYPTRDPAVIESIRQAVMDARPSQNTPKAIKEFWDSDDSMTNRLKKAIADTGKNPLLAEPIVICATTDFMQGEVASFWFDLDCPGSSLTLLAKFIDQYCDDRTIWTGHSIEGYDLPLVLSQFQKCGIIPPVQFPTYRRGHWRGPIHDTMLATPGKTPFISLANACLAYGLKAKGVEWRGKPMDGSRVAEAFDAGEYAMIGEYCMQDTLDEYALFQVQTYGGTWGIGGRSDATANALAEIAESTLTPAQKWLSAVPLLQSAGLL